MPTLSEGGLSVGGSVRGVSVPTLSEGGLSVGGLSVGGGLFRSGGGLRWRRRRHQWLSHFRPPQ